MVGKIPWRREWLPTPVFLSGESLGQRSLLGYSPWGHKELHATERLTLRLLLLYRVPDLLLGTDDKTDTHSGQAPASNYVKHAGYQVGADAREESMAEAKGRVILVSGPCSLKISRAIYHLRHQGHGAG